MRRAWGRLIAALVCVTAVVGGTPGLVSAHAELESSSPSANSVLEVGPAAIVLDFDEAIETPLSSIALYDGEGTSFPLGPPVTGADDTVVQVLVDGEMADGVFAVIWRVTSADGHVIDGAFSFQVGTAAAGGGQQLIDQVRARSKADTAVKWWYGVARLLSMIGAIALVGAGWWLVRGPAQILRRRRSRWVAVACWLALLVGSFATFALFSAQTVAGSVGDAFDTDRWGDVATTQTGRMVLLRIVLALGLGGLLAVRRNRVQGWWRGAAVAAGLATLFTFSAAGHANAQSPAAVWVGVDLLHLIAVTVWIGGLLALCLTDPGTLAQPEGERMARRFSLAASICVPIIVLTGVAQTLKLAGGLDDVAATDWGRLLLVKVAVVVALLAIAGVSRWLLHHDGALSIRRTLITEFAIGVVVVGLAAGMVALPPVAPTVSKPFETQLTGAGVIAALSLGPGSVGANEVHVTVTPPGGSITPVVAVTARVSLPADGIPVAPVTLVQDGPNHYRGTVTVPRSGDWTVELVIQITDAESVLLKTTVPIP